MTLPKKPPIVEDWSEANLLKRDTRCRYCGATNRKIELAHVIGREHDVRDAIEQDGIYKGRPSRIRLVRINPDRVLSLCGPSVDTGTCHHGHDHTTGDVEIWDCLTDEEKRQAIADAGSLGLAVRRCAPKTWEDRLEFLPDGQLVEVQI